MAWLRIELTADEQRIAQDERESHPDPCVRRRLWALWLLHCGAKREQAAKILGVAVSTVQRDLFAYRTGGLEALRKSGRAYKPTSELAQHQDPIRQSLEQKPALDAAQAGQGHVFFVDAAHFVFGTFLCCLWSFTRIFVRAASGRQRFNVLGAWNAVTRQLLAVTNTTVVNTDSMCELLRKIAAQGLTGPISVVLDNARYQRNAVVMALASQLGISLLFLPSYSPNLNLIERRWKFTKRRSLYGRYHPTFAEFRAAIEKTLADIPTQHAAELTSLMTLNFQRFENVSLMAA